MKIMQIDSPLMQILNKIADVIIINLLTLLLCIPIITAGAAITAMHYCCLKVVRDDENSIVKQFFHSFKENFGQSTIMWMIMLVIAAIIGVDFYLLYDNATETGSYVFWGLLLVIAIYTFIMSMVFPIQAKFANPIPKTLKFAFVYSFRHFLSTLAIVLATLLQVVLVRYLIAVLPLVLCTCFAGPGMVAAALYNKPFKKLEDKYLEAHPTEDPSAGDEHIFSDEPIISTENNTNA